MVSSCPSLILHLDCKAKCLAIELCVQLDMQECDIKLNTGNKACPPPLAHANEFVHNKPIALSISSSVYCVKEQSCLKTKTNLLLRQYLNYLV